MRKIYTRIDIGSDTFKIIVGEAYEDKINVLAASTIKSKGIRKGLIVDSNLAVNAIRDGIKEINNELGFEIKKIITNVPDYNVKFMYVTGKINVDGIIETRHVSTVIKDSVYNKLDKDYELVTVVPLDFIIDGHEGNDRPVGIECNILEIKGIMISVPKKNIYSVVSVLEAAGLEVVDITISGLADYYQVRNKKTDKKLGAIINLGHETTNVSIINNGKIMNTETIQLGGINVENDIAYVFGTNIVDARKIKEKFALCNKRFTNLKDTYELTNNIGETVNVVTGETIMEGKRNRFADVNIAKESALEIIKSIKGELPLVGLVERVNNGLNFAIAIKNRQKRR